jgi:hypothetical protein
VVRKADSVTLRHRAMLVFGLFTHMACGATYALVPFIDSKALGGVAGIIGAGGNVGAVAGGLLMKGTGNIQQTLAILGVLVIVSAACAIAVRFTIVNDQRSLAGTQLKEFVMKIIVIGHGMVGHKFLESLAASGAPHLEVTVLCEEPRAAYDRVHLSEFFSGKTAEDLSLVAPGFFERDNLLLKLNARAVAVDRKAKKVTVSSGEVLDYDKLVFATGSYPFVPPVPGKDRKDCFVYRTIEDLEAMLECGQRSKTGVVIGGGLLGLECAKALRDMNLETHVVEFAPRLMAVQVDDGGARVLRTRSKTWA